MFHKASSPNSTRILTLLKQANAAADPSKEQPTAFDLDVTEGPPTSDQLQSILEYVGDTNIAAVVNGASDATDAQRKLRLTPDAFQRPLVGGHAP
jgi:hypothetical protein